MEYNRKEARKLSMIGHRGAMSTALTELAESDESMVVLVADVAMLSGLEKFQQKHPDRFYNIGIAEQNMVGVAAGLARQGLHVFASTYANFLTMRAFEQIRINLGYMQENVKLVGFASGLEMGVLGNTHYCFEDIALMSVIPGMAVVAPADGFEIVKTLKWASEYEGPVYIRLTGELNGMPVYTEDFDFVFGKVNEICSGEEIAILGTGSILSSVIKAKKTLAEMGVSVGIYDVATIKPMDQQTLKEIVGKYKLIVTVEEHSVIGGLGSIVAQTMSEWKDRLPIKMIGVQDRFSKPGSYEYLLQQNGLTAQQIAETVMEAYKNVDK